MSNQEHTNDLDVLLEEYHEEFKNDPEYRAIALYDAITADFLRHMRKHDISRSELAQRMGVSEAFISRIFSEHQNFTLKTLAKIEAALDMEITLSARQEQDFKGAIEWDRKKEKFGLFPVRGFAIGDSYQLAAQELGPGNKSGEENKIPLAA